MLAQDDVDKCGDIGNGDEAIEVNITSDIRLENNTLTHVIGTDYTIRREANFLTGMERDGLIRIVIVGFKSNKVVRRCCIVDTKVSVGGNAYALVADKSSNGKVVVVIGNVGARGETDYDMGCHAMLEVTVEE